jgi:hypothetical protein
MNVLKPSGTGQAFLRYTVLRLLLFLATFVVLAAVGIGGFPGLLLALLVSSIISYVVLRSSRTRLGEAVEGVVARTRAAYAAPVSAEDAAAEEIWQAQQRSLRDSSLHEAADRTPPAQRARS